MKKYLPLIVVAAVTAAVVAPISVYASHRFVDVPTDHIFHEDIAWLAEAGVTKGCNPPANTEFCPDDVVTRGQMAAFLRRLSEGQVVDARSVMGVEPTDLAGEPGPQGPEGPAGPQGPPGPPGIVGFAHVSTGFPADPNSGFPGQPAELLEGALVGEVESAIDSNTGLPHFGGVVCFNFVLGGPSHWNWVIAQRDRGVQLFSPTDPRGPLYFEVNQAPLDGGLGELDLVCPEDSDMWVVIRNSEGEEVVDHFRYWLVYG